VTGVRFLALTRLVRRQRKLRELGEPSNIGSDADKGTLTRIAASAHGTYWDAKNPQRAVDAYRQIAVHY